MRKAILIMLLTIIGSAVAAKWAFGRAGQRQSRYVRSIENGSQMNINDYSFPPSFEHLINTAHHVAERAWSGLYNFLMGQSILILAWAAILSTKMDGVWFILVVISVVGVIIGFQWAMLGTRMWQYHLEYAERLESVASSFQEEVQGAGAATWREVNAVINAHWRDKNEFRQFRATSGNQIILYAVPLMLSFLHMCMFSFVVIHLLPWPTIAVWIPCAILVVGWIVFVYWYWGVRTICRPVLERPNFGAS
jgi:hypothetical protein